MKKKRLITVVLSIVLAFSLSVTAFACDSCKSDSQTMSGTGTITGDGVSLRPHHNTSVSAGGYAYTGDVGVITHAYASRTNPTWYRMEMYYGNSAGINGWVYYSYVRVS